MQNDPVNERRHDAILSINPADQRNIRDKSDGPITRMPGGQQGGTKAKRAGTRGPRPASEEKLLLRRHDADDLAATLGAELDRTGGEGEERVIATATDLVTGVELGPALPDQDLPGADDLTTEPLDTQALRGGVTAVPRAGCTLFMSHG
jgi:hypothetical protein